MLSKASKYAIRSVLVIANNPRNKKKIGSKKIAEKLNIPAPFLAKTLQILTKENIISSVKGPNGGFYLSKENQNKTLFDIIDCVDNSAKFEHCFLGQIQCSEENPCVVHHLYAPFKYELIKKLKNKTIVEMAVENRNNTNFTENFIK